MNATYATPKMQRERAHGWLPPCTLNPQQNELVRSIWIDWPFCICAAANVQSAPSEDAAHIRIHMQMDGVVLSNVGIAAALTCKLEASHPLQSHQQVLLEVTPPTSTFLGLSSPHTPSTQLTQFVAQTCEADCPAVAVLAACAKFFKFRALPT